MTADEIKEIIFDKQIKVVSFDIFDTLLVRPFYAPADLFEFLDVRVTELLGTTEHVDFKKYRTEAEQVTRRRFSSKGEDVTLDEIYDCLREMMELTAEKAALIKAWEIESEIRFCRPRMFAKSLFEMAKQSGKGAIITSDMYLPQSVVEHLLQKNSYKGYDRLYLSSALRITKSTGHLYEYIAKDMGVAPEHILHIGDNETADVRKARSQGFQACHFPKCSDLLMNTVSGMYTGAVFQKAYGESFLNRFGILQDYLGIRTMLAMVANRVFDNPFRSFRSDSDFDGDAADLGYAALGMQLFSVADWLHREMQGKGFDNLCFMARDGYLPMKAFEILKACYPGEFPAICYCHFNRTTTLPLRIRKAEDLLQLSRSIVPTAKSPQEVLEVFAELLSEGKLEQAERICEENGFPYRVKFASFSQWNDFVRFFQKYFYEPERFALHRKQMQEALARLLPGRTATFDIGYHYRAEDTLKSLGLDITPYCIHIIDDLALRRAGRDGFPLHTFYGYTPVISGMVRELFISEPVPSCKKLIIRDGRIEPSLEHGGKLIGGEMLRTMQESAIFFVQDMADTFGRDIRNLYYQREDAALAFDYFLLHPKRAELELFADIFDDDFMQDKQFDIVEFWQYQIRQLANGGLWRGDDLRFRFPEEAVPRGTRLIIYGGGEVGRTFLRQARKSGKAKIVALCDREPDLTGIRDAALITPAGLAGIEQQSYDMVLIAIEREQIAKDIRKNLEELGVPKEKIKWIDPARDREIDKMR